MTRTIAILVFATLSLQAATLEVGSGKTYSTITLAIAAASANDTVSVFDGVYSESPTVAPAGVTISAASGNTPSIIGRFVIGDSNVTIRGIAIGGWTNANAGGVHSSGYSGLTVENCTITNGVNSASGIYIRNGGNMILRSNFIAGNGTGININSGSGTSYDDGIRITANTICSNYFDGLDLHGRWITVSGNAIFRNFDTNWLTHHPDGIQLIDSTVDGQQGCQNLRITGNTIYSHPQNIFGGYWTTNILIANNVLYNEEGTISGVSMESVTTKHIGLFSGSNVLIANNTLGRALNSGIYISYDAAQATGGYRITNNIITGVVSNGIGIYIANASDIAGIDHNLYYGNSYAARIAAAFYTTVADFAAATAYEDHGVASDPVLTDWVPQTGSHAMAAGASLTEFSDDFTGRARVPPWDVGAYESAIAATANAITVGTLISP